MTDESQVVRFEYQQSLSFTAGASWSEQVAVSVRILSEAFSSGWYRETFGKDAKSFIVLMAIVMHARPLRGEDLELLIRLGMATREDEGRLYARVTDLGLADELGIHRVTISQCAEKLAGKGAIRIAAIPEGYEFRDSRGQYAGSKVYIVSGSLDSILQKGIAHRVEKTDTVEPPESSHGVEKTDTDRVRKPDINIDSDSDSDEEDVNGVTAALPPALAYFAERRDTPGYCPTEKENQALQSLLMDGFDLETEIFPGIDRAIEKAKSPIGSFNYCAQVIRQMRKEAQAEQEKREQREPAPVVIPPNLAEAAQILTEVVDKPDRATLARLTAMTNQCEAAAAAEDSTGGKWVADAITEAFGRANPQYVLSYAGKILQSWVAQGRCKAHGSVVQEAVQIPSEITVFHEATGRMPLRDQVEMVTRAIRENGLSAAYLKHYWEEWVLRDRRRTDLTWLIWAVKGEIPDAPNTNQKATNGLEEMLQNLAFAAQKGA